MLQKYNVIGLLFVGASFFAPATACEFHDMGFGPMGSKWSAYYPDDQMGFGLEDHGYTNSDTAKVTSLKEREPMTPSPVTRTRPSFSSASIRAANTAKAKLAQKAPKEQTATKILSKSDR